MKRLNLLKWALAPFHRPLPDHGHGLSHRLGIELLEDRSLPSNVVLDWNELLLQALANQPAGVPLSRNMALVHTAMFDAVNAIDRSYEPYHAQVHASHGASPEAAAAQAAHDTLVALYPSQQAIFAAALAEDLADIPRGRAMQGIAIGQEVARQILALRTGDGSTASMSYTPPNTDPGQWQPTGPDFSPAGAVHVSHVKPYAVVSMDQFLPGPPPALDSAEYATAFNEAKTLGVATGSTRTDDQTLVAGLWRTALNNHQVWNRIAQDVADTRDLSLAESARLFALMDIALHDALATSFGAKYHYALWRPITAIQRAAEDGNPATDADPAWATLHPSTPPYPTYSGNAATIGATCATVMADVFGSNDIPFQINWERQGFTGVTRSYSGFWAAAQETADSRIYGGIHFRFDSVAGQEIGANVGEYVLENFLRPLGKEKDSLKLAPASSILGNESVSADQIQKAVSEAIALWQAVGIESPGWHGFTVRAAESNDSTPEKVVVGMIWLDDSVVSGRNHTSNGTLPIVPSVEADSEFFDEFLPLAVDAEFDTWVIPSRP